MKHKPQSHKTLSWLIIGVSICLLACGLASSKELPSRPFTTSDLLIDLETMPESWYIVSGPEESQVEFNFYEGFWIKFETESAEATYRVASHNVYQYPSERKAISVYRSFVLPYIEGRSTPAEWTYKSSLSNIYQFTCHDYEGKTQYYCEWSGVYEEYIVIFRAWLIPDKMTLSDIETVVQAIEVRMEQNLEDVNGVSSSDK